MSENKTEEQRDLSVRLEEMALDIEANWGVYSTPTLEAYKEVASLFYKARARITELEKEVKELNKTLDAWRKGEVF